MNLWRATLLKKRPLTHDVMHFDFEISEGLYTQAGQFIMLQVSEKDWRAYSVAGVSSNGKTFSLCIKLIEGGLGSEFLRHLQEGESASFKGPMGHFYLREDAPESICMIATGTGLAPFMAMLPRLAEHKLDSVALLFGVRHEEDLFYQEELAQFSKTLPHFQAISTVSQASEAWQGARGRVTDHLAPFLHANTRFYICGNGSMVKSVRETLLEAGIDKTQIHLEQFNAF